MFLSNCFVLSAGKRPPKLYINLDRYYGLSPYRKIFAMLKILPKSTPGRRYGLLWPTHGLLMAYYGLLILQNVLLE